MLNLVGVPGFRPPECVPTIFPTWAPLVSRSVIELVHVQRKRKESIVSENDFFPFSGKLAGISVWHRQLEQEEITARFSARKNQFPGAESLAPVRPGNDDEWATWMSDNLRSGRAPGSVTLHPSGRPLWVYYPQKRPAPAWPGTAEPP